MEDVPKCDRDEVQCPSGDCIPDTHICDGEDDCPSGWDEDFCIPAVGNRQTRFSASHLLRV